MLITGNVRNMMLHPNAVTLRGLTYFILWLISYSIWKLECTKFPLDGEGSIASAMPRE